MGLTIELNDHQTHRLIAELTEVWVQIRQYQELRRLNGLPAQGVDLDTLDGIARQVQAHLNHAAGVGETPDGPWFVGLRDEDYNR